ncbi:family 20 glycosylhydrolase [Aestuariibaculum sp. M13]|uniref:family 20 glycosylhydrolase n=1 Tax=Aestuariibaculum sp. M13 TaxID=2967132 RepID=UPI002159E5C2|nr:family 20 glycosylhydrolase [Aestuariibaculum sp. M13]MCR8668731.1 family 20 glycosylhydrolase [Aestuariibaculum sp. M13]
MPYFVPLLLISLLFSSCELKPKSFSENEISLVPKPVSMTLKHGSFLFSSSTSIYTDNNLQKPAATYLSDLFNKAARFPLKMENSTEKANVVFSEDVSIKPEGYQLVVSSEKIEIKASDAAGYFYGVQTLRQLLPPAIEVANSISQTWLVPGISITDEPRFSWRGMHMDFSRHFFGIDEVKTFLDYMALYKLNTYHMHLTDDQGWRIEIKKYPLLTNKGAWRIESSHDKACKEKAKADPSFTINPNHYHDIEEKRMYGGFFTQDQIKEIIAYAADRQIEVIPEIDMPGHSKAAIDNYLYLSCTNEAGWGKDFSTPACLGKESTYEFTKNILSEIVDLFPSDYIHIGGDEVNIQSWKECPLCKKTIKDKQLENEHELQSYFNREIEAFLNSKGKKLIGWDEIVEGGLSNSATMMWWRNWAPKMIEIAAEQGNDMIITPCFEYYFDAQHEVTPFKKVYNYEPIPEDFSKEQTQYILGIQANLWSEMIPNFKRLQYQAFPRLLAMAETAWTPKEHKNFNDFENRMNLQYNRLDTLNIHYHIPSVKGLKDKVAFLDNTTITLEAPLENMDIYYTTNGDTPTKSSKKYTGPFQISESTTLKTIAFRGKLASDIKSAEIEKQTYLESLAIEPKMGSLKRWAAVNQFTVVDDVELPENATFESVNDIQFKGFNGKSQVSLVFNGYFYANTDGLFEFSTKSDDGSLLYIGNNLVVNNGGNHSAIEKNGMVALKQGWHPLTIKFHEATGGGQLTVWYQSPNGEKNILKGNVIAE